MPRIADPGVDERRRAAVAGQQVGVVAGAGHRTGIVSAGRSSGNARSLSPRQLVSKTIPKHERDMRVPMVLPEKVVAVAADADAGDRGAPVLSARLRVLDLRVDAIAVLANGVFERDAAVRIDGVRGAADDRPRQRRDRARRSAAARRAVTLRRHSRRRTPTRRSGVPAGRRRARSSSVAGVARWSKYAASPFTVNQRVGSAASAP